MAMSAAALAADLEKAFAAMGREQATDRQAAEMIAAAVDKFVRSASVAGTASGVQNGPGTAPVTGGLS